MVETPRVSVVMAVHNGGAYLGRAVQSILEQTFGDFEFVIVNDGSTDTTADVLQHAQAADGRVRVLQQDKAGLVASLNRGCGEARGAYIARMDADDIAFPTRLSRQVEFLDRHPAVAVVGSAVVRIDAAGREITRNVCPTTHAEIVEALQQYTCFTHPTVMVRAAALAAVGGYRPAYRAAEDYDLWLRLSERYELANLPDPLLYYRVYPDQVSVRQLDQQVLSVVGARAAARQRMQTGQRPKSRTRVDLGGAAERVGCSGDRVGGRHGRALSLRRVCDGAGRAPRRSARPTPNRPAALEGPRRPWPDARGCVLQAGQDRVRRGSSLGRPLLGHASVAGPAVPSPPRSPRSGRGAPQYGRTRRSTGVTGPRVPVLMYHEVSASPASVVSTLHGHRAAVHPPDTLARRLRLSPGRHGCAGSVHAVVRARCPRGRW